MNIQPILDNLNKFAGPIMVVINPYKDRLILYVHINDFSFADFIEINPYQVTVTINEKLCSYMIESNIKISNLSTILDEIKNQIDTLYLESNDAKEQIIIAKDKNNIYYKLAFCPSPEEKRDRRKNVELFFKGMNHGLELCGEIIV